VTFLPQGTYFYLLKSTAHQELVNFQKIWSTLNSHAAFAPSVVGAAWGFL
jgi:hypothetical protein